MLHATSRLSLFFIITLSLSTLCLAQDDPRTLRLAEQLLAAPTDGERDALLTAEKELKTAKLVKALLAKANRLRLQGKPDEAGSVNQLALRISEEIGDDAGAGSALLNLGFIHRSRGQYEPALESYNKSLGRREKIGDKVGIAATLNQIGYIYSLQGNQALALDYYRRSLSLAEAIGDKNVIAQTLNNIGIAHFQQGDYTSAMAYYMRSLPLREEVGDKEGVVVTHNSIGNVHYSLSNFDLSLQHYRKCLELGQSLKNKDAITAAMLLNIGAVYQVLGDYGLAMEHYQKGLALHESHDEKLAIAGSLLNIGTVHKLQNNNDLALEFMQRSLKLYEAMGDKSHTAGALTSLGEVRYAQGRYDLALELYDKALKLAEEVGDKPDVISILDGIGLVHFKAGNYDLANQYYEKSLTLNEPLGDRNRMLQTLTGMAQASYAQRHYRIALKSAERATALARQIGTREWLWQALTNKGNAHVSLREQGQAHGAFAEAIATIEDLRGRVSGGEDAQQRFFEDKLSPYHGMIELLVATNRSNDALVYAERAKARVLLDVLQSGRMNVTKAMTIPEQARERNLKGELVSFNSQISHESSRSKNNQTLLADLEARRQKARLEYETFQASLYAAHPELKVRRGEARPVSLDETAALLPDAESALVQYVVTGDKTFLFVVTRGSAKVAKPIDLKVFTLDVKRKDLTTRVEHFREQLARRDVRFAASARQLHALLLAPAQRELRGKRTLVIVPDAALWELPFQALQPATNRFLIEDHAVSYAPSLTALREIKRARRKNPGGASTSAATLLAFGNPTLGKPTVERVKSVMMDGELDPLPEAEKQVRALGRLYGASRSRVYTGAAAREERVKAEAGNYRILQLATHGILNDASPMYSHVMLAQGGGDGADKSSAEDGLLEAWEMMNLDLNADLVVLSACETARGRVGAGEGVIGLTWALFVAGTPTTVVSQWKVESASTTELMLEFHRNLQPRTRQAPPRTTTANALQQAAIEMMRSRDYRHPFYWAGFVVVGDGN